MSTLSGAGDEGGDALVAVDEEFLHTVATANVIDADAELWSTFERFLGNDPVGAWTLTEVTHRPVQICDEEGKPTGEWELVSSAKWSRDPNAPTPIRLLQIAEQLDEEVASG